jgi:hypothetical protein
MPPVVVPSSTFGSLPSPGTPGSLARVTDHGTWISWFCSGLTVSNDYMTSGSRAIFINGSSCHGINVTGNFFAGSAAGNMAEDINLNSEPNAQTARPSRPPRRTSGSR